MAFWGSKKKRGTESTAAPKEEKTSVRVEASRDISATSATCFNKTVSLTSALDLEVRLKGSKEWVDGETFGLPVRLWRSLGDAVAMRRYYGVAVWLNGRVLPSTNIVADYNGDSVTVKIDGKYTPDARVSVLTDTGLSLGVRSANRSIIESEEKILDTGQQTTDEFKNFGRVISVPADAPKGYVEGVKERIASLRNGQDVVLREDVQITRFNDDTLLECFPADTLRTLRQGVCGAWLVPYDLVYVDSSNRATAEVARSAFLRDTLYPDACAVCADFGDFGLDGVEEIRPKRLDNQEVSKVEAAT